MFVIDVGAGKPADATESAIIVPVPAAERVVGHHRKVLDHSAQWGVPAHVTVLYPFVPPERIVGSTIDEVGAALAGVHAFGCRFSQVKWFGEEVVWLAPEPDGPFRELTRAVWHRFPDHPPYRGAHPDSIPHLTVGSTRVADLASMRSAATEVQAELPIDTWIDRARLIVGTDAPGSWRTLAEFVLPPE